MCNWRQQRRGFFILTATSKWFQAGIGAFGICKSDVFNRVLFCYNRRCYTAEIKKLAAEGRTADMKKLIVCMVLAMVMGISGCLSYSPVDPDENQPWNGRHDPYQIRGGGGR